MLAVKIEHFEGPLDLLLNLIEEEKLDITEVSLARVAAQYLECLSQFSKQHLIEELSDFIVIAAKLLLLKSRALVPALAPEEEEEIEELKSRLKIYRAFIDAGKKIDTLFKKRRVAFPRQQSLIHDIGFIPPRSVTSAILRDTFVKILQSIEEAREKPKEIIFPSRVSIQEKIQEIIVLLSRRARMTFRDVVSNARSKADVVVSFMALLEIVKQRDLEVSQKKIFDDIVITERNSAVCANQRGQTLIEVITALAVIAVGLVGVLSLATSNVRNQGIGLSRLFANNLAREGVEIVRNMRDTNWLSEQPWYEGLAGSSSCAVLNAFDEPLDFVPCPSGGAFFDEKFRLYRFANSRENETGALVSFDEYRQKGTKSAVEGDATAFYRKIQLDPICLTAEKDAETFTGCAQENAIGMRVTSEVSWKQSGQDFLARIRENIYNWR